MSKITIQEIAAVLTQKNGLDKREANRFVSEMFAVILNRLETDHLVKVRGLGTFKLISVEARESVSVRTGERVVIGSHAKVTFTPDSIIRELVNKPFSQFETVVLNDGVEFEDLSDDLTPEELAAAPPDTVDEEPQDVIIEPQTLVADPVPVMEDPVLVAAESTPVTPETASVTEEPTSITVEPEPIEEPAPVAPIPPDDPILPFDDETSPSRPWGRWLLTAVGVLALMVLSAYGGFRYGRATAPTVVPEAADTLATDTLIADTLAIDTTMQTLPVEAEEDSLQTDEPTPYNEVQKEEQPLTVDQYGEKDERVRLGAYRIVGTAEEVEVLAGQTFYSICRAHLGPDMECYVEVYNDLPRNAQVKAGQIIKIPKLELKKKRK